MNNLGYVVTGEGSGPLDDVLTWHDRDGLRIWIHSKATRNGRETISIEVQLINSGAPKPSKEEVTLRLRLSTRLQLPKDSRRFSATLFRTLQTGHLLDEHSAVVTQIINDKGTKRNRRIQLVEEVATNTVDLSRRRKWNSAGITKLDKVKSIDAILIAKVYESLQSSGTRKLSARTAEVLGLDVAAVHTGVQVARRNGWLTSNGTGHSGGFLTEKGEEKFLEVRGPERLVFLLDSMDTKWHQ